MILAVLIIIIIVLIYNNVYSYYSKEKSHNLYAYKKKPTSCEMSVHDSMMPAHTHAHAQMQAKVYQPESMYDAQDYQEQSRRTRTDAYDMDSMPIRSKEEYMTDKYNKSYMQAVTSQPTAANYNEYMISTGLEASVVSSHKEFVDETQNKTTGASTETVFSHDDSIVPSWGLRRHSAHIPINPNSREVPSQTNEQLNDNTENFKYGLF